MKILIACEESQRVCIEMRRLGHECYSADIQEPSGGHPEWHILGDVLPLINGRCTFATMDGVKHEISGKWDMLIAHPPCTYLTAASACRLFDKNHNINNKQREQKLWEAAAFFNQFLNADCEKIAVENPAPLKYCKLPKYTQIIEPYFFGDPWKKRTCLWLKGLPPLQKTNCIEPTSCWVETNGRTCRTKLRGARGATSAKLRSKTFPGKAALWRSNGQETHLKAEVIVMSKIKLLPCPFCGSNKISLYSSLFGQIHGKCNCCGASSGNGGGSTAEEAAEAWNCRADTEKTARTAEG